MSIDPMHIQTPDTLQTYRAADSTPDAKSDHSRCLQSAHSTLQSVPIISQA